MHTILLVDDDRETRNILHAIFTRSQYEVVAAETLDTAEQIIRERRIDLVVCDVMLADGNAFAFRKRLTDPPPFLFLSGYSQSYVDYIPSEGTSFGMKPVNPAYLVAKAADLIDSDQRGGRHGQHA